MKEALQAVLQAVEWSAEKMCEDSEIDVPEEVLRLNSSNAQERRDAANQLEGAVAPQGNLYEAAFDVIPVLTFLLRQPTFVGREVVYDLLTPMFLGTPARNASVRLETGDVVPLAQGCQTRIAEGWTIYLADACNRALSSRCRKKAVLQLGEIEQWSPTIAAELGRLVSDEPDTGVKDVVKEVLQSRKAGA